MATTYSTAIVKCVLMSLLMQIAGIMYRKKSKFQIPKKVAIANLKK